MPRPLKCRAICEMPHFPRFAPLGIPRGANGAVIMTVDEFESFRLIEQEGLTQQQASERMQVSRTTVQAIHDRASHKIADCLANGRELIVEGGDYSICDGQRSCCHEDDCPRGKTDRPLAKDSPKGETQRKGDDVMRIAVPVKADGETVNLLLARAPRFALAEDEAVRFVNNEAADSEGGAGIKAAQQLVDLGVDVILAQQCGVNAAEVLAAAGIELYRVKSDSLADSLADYRAGALDRLTDAIPGIKGQDGK